MIKFDISLSELSNVKGIGKKTIDRVKKYLDVKEYIRNKRDTDLKVDKLETNVIHCQDNIKGMRELIPDNTIDLTVTSPPYDDLREYEGEWDFNFKELAQELYRATKKGGVVVWVVGDQTINGSETGNSFRQALYFKEIGFNLHDTMIYAKENYLPLNDKRYEPQFEYMFVFTIGQPKTFNPIKIESKYGGIQCGKFTQRNKKGELPDYEILKVKDKKTKPNIWHYQVGYMKSSKDKIAYEHPATFPEKLAKDHIKSWSNEGDVVLDPFMGSGTTAKMAEILDRKWIGFEISQKYVNLAYKRVGNLDKKYYDKLPDDEKPKQTQMF